MRLILAVKAFWNTLLGKNFGPVSTVAAPVDMSAFETIKADRKALKSPRDQFETGAVYTLVLLQREGRLIDFLMENIDIYEDSQVGAAVRRIHQTCGKTLSEHFQIRKIIDQSEGAAFRVDEKLDRSRVRLVGNVPDMLPFEGFVQHPGWECAKIELPERNDALEDKIIYPAEVGF